jgi:hypothetical protein
MPVKLIFDSWKNYAFEIEGESRFVPLPWHYTT